MNRYPPLLRLAAITVLGSGLLRPANATWGSLASVLLFVLMLVAARSAGGGASVVSLLTLLGILAACWLSVAWGDWAILYFARKDPRPFVLDEFAGQWIALLAAPGLFEGRGDLLLGALVSQFVLFRFFDILKPPPARQLEQLPGGLGVLCDDLMAGVYANLAGQALWRMTPLAAWVAPHLTWARGWLEIL